MRSGWRFIIAPKLLKNYSKEFFSSPIKTSAKTSEFIVEGFVITDLNIGTIS